LFIRTQTSGGKDAQRRYPIDTQFVIYEPYGEPKKGWCRSLAYLYAVDVVRVKVAGMAPGKVSEQ